MAICAELFPDVDLSEPFTASPLWKSLWNRYWEVPGLTGEVCEVPVLSTVATQPTVDSERVQQYVDGEVPPRRRLPLVARYNSRYYIVDGHHRVGAAIVSGKPSIACEVFILN